VDNPGDCPFCVGHERDTAQERLRLGDGPAGWDVRVVDNLYPALRHHEVVVHGWGHRTRFSTIPDATLDLVAEAWQRRAHDAGGTVFPYVNEGLTAGSSQTHSHSQLAWLPTPPPAVLAERGLPTAEAAFAQDGLVVGAASSPRSDFELQIVPERWEPEGLRSDLLGPALRLAAECLRRLDLILGREVPFNLWLHEGSRWHLELVPRLTTPAGLELGAGVWTVTVDPADAARRLRETV
jgi:UDPglucose--hexose-1-phosphate uridylyltransferase